MTADTIAFTKMHGIGNDYVYVDGFAHDVADPAELAVRMADRHFGIGSDGLILILPAEAADAADVRMRMFNADGSESEMCGNGIRCVCKFAHDRGLARRRPMRVETGAGVLELDYHTGPDGKVDAVRVDMGPAELDVARLPIVPDALASLEATLADDPELELLDRPVPVGVGNPHWVLFVPDVVAVPLVRLGPMIEMHPAFPERVNAHFVEVVGPREVTMRTWERGSGPTLACGTGASAVGVAANHTGRTEPTIIAHLPGGDLEIEWDAGRGHVFMTGPATEVFHGVWRD